MARPAAPRPRPRRRLLLAAALAPSAWCLAPSLRAQPRGAGELLIGGTGVGLGPAARVLAPRGDVRVVPSMGSGGGIKAVQAGAIDIALSARPLHDAERAAGLVAQDWFRTPVAWAAHPAVPATALSLDELLALYGGRTARWPGGEAVRLVLRPESDSDTALMRGIAPAAAEALRQAHARPGVLVASTDGEAVESIARLPGALGITTLGMVLTEQPTLKVLEIDAVRPSLQTLATGRWALVKSVRLVTRGAPAAPVRAVMDTLRSAAAGQVLAALGCQLQTAR
ncbi:MAG: substrate-binding domain-containing protein [Rubrivivax sp.]